jgi:hypothetical protein
MQSFEDALLNSREKLNRVPGWGDDDPDANNLPDNSILLLAVTDGEIYYNERI